MSTPERGGAGREKAPSAGTTRCTGTRRGQRARAGGEVRPLLRRRSRMGPRRAAVLIGVHVVFAAHLAHWWVKGRTLSPIEPSEAMQTLEQGRVNAGFLFFGAAILLTLVFGRFFCGWGCHVVALQDLCAHLMRRAGLRPRLFRSRLLALVPVGLALYMFVWPSAKRIVLPPLRDVVPGLVELLGGAPPPFPGFHADLVKTDFWETFAPPLLAVPFLLICGFAVVYLLGAKGFCAYGCPYGGVFGPVDRLATGKIVVDQTACEQCGHCTATCTSNVRVHEEIKTYGMVVDSGCMKCMDCISVCPNEALSFRLTRPTLLSRGPKRVRVYDLSIAGEIACLAVFLAAFLAVRGAYGTIPMLMAVGTALCVVFLTYTTLRLAREENAALHRFTLKAQGRWTKHGVLFAAVAALACALVVHTGLVQGVRASADRLDRRVAVPREVALRATPGTLPQELVDAALAARARLARVQPFWRNGLGLLPTPGLELRIAWLDVVAGRHEEAREALEAYARAHGPSPALSADIARLLELEGTMDGAADRFEESLRLDPSSAAVRSELATLLIRQRRFDRAIGVLTEAVARDSLDGRAHHDLAAALYASGRREEALGEMERAAELLPNDRDVARRLAEMRRRVAGVESAEDPAP